MPDPNAPDSGREPPETSAADAVDADNRDARLEFAAAASARLATSLDLGTTLESVVALAVPRVADIGVVEMLGDDGQLHRVAVHAREPGLGERLAAMAAVALPLELDGVLPQLARSGGPMLLDQPSTFRAIYGREPRDSEPASCESAMLLPLDARGRRLGVMLLLATGESGRRFGAADLELARDLAQRAALAADNARLYEDAQRAIEGRDQILAIVSHDLRNPLSAILMGASFLQKAVIERETVEKVRKQGAIIERSARRMNRLISDLLDLAAIEAGRFSVERQAVTVDVLLNEAIEMARPIAEQRNLRLERDDSVDSIQVLCDRERIVQVLGNLLGNAIKFTPPEGEVRVGVGRASGVVQFSVRDTGPGIAPDQIPHLFERYWRGTARRGTGLGLFIVKGIVDAHGGRLFVTSRLGNGTEIGFTLPVT